MADRIISLRLQLKGNDQTLKNLDAITLPLQETGKLLKDIKTQSVSLDIVSKKVKTLTQQFQELNKEAGKFGGSTTKTGTGAKTSTAPKVVGNTNADLRAELATLDQQSARYKEIIGLLGQFKQKQAEINAALRQQAKEFEATKFAVGSYKDLNYQLGKARDAYRQLGEAERKGAQGKGLLQNISQLDTRLKGIDASMGQYTRSVGHYSTALSGLQSVASQYLSFTALLAVGGQIVRQNAEISDSIANVAKTANASIPEIQKLSEELKFRDTRTSLADQLKIAEIGGQLGETADTLASFTAAIDVLGVALGDEFGNDVGRVTKEVAGLRNTLGDFKTDDAAGDILKLGNALNVLSASGNATAGVTTDIASRLAGLGTAFGLTTGQIIGLASRLDELNIPAERAGGAIQRVLKEIAESPEIFAQFSGKSIPEFTKAVNEDLVGAFINVLDTVAASDLKTTEFANTLEELGLGGVGAIEIFSKLGQDTDALRKSIELATTSLQNTDSVYTEFTKKNQTLGAELAKLKNVFLNTFTDSGISDGLATIVKGLQKVVPVLKDLISILFNTGPALKNIVKNMFGAKKQADDFAQSTENLTKKITTGFKSSLDALKNYADGEKEVTKITFEEVEERLRLQKEAKEKLKAAAKEAEREAKAQREKEKQDIIQAAENIQKLQLELFEENFAGRRAKLEKEAEIAVAALVGTPEQVKEQTTLINAILKEDLADLEKQFKAAREKALQEIKSFRDEIGEGTADFQLFGSQREVSAINRFYEAQVQQLRLTRAQQFAELEKALAKGEVTATEFEEKRVLIERQFQQKRLDSQKFENAELLVAEADLLQKQLIQREVAFQAELAQIERQRAERQKAITEQVESGAITPSEGTAGIQSSDALANSLKLEEEQKFLEEKDKLQADFAAKQISRQIETAEQEADVVEKKNQKLLRLQQQYEDTLKASFESLGTALGEFLTGQERSNEQFLKNLVNITIETIKDIILLQLQAMAATALAQPDSVATFGATGVARIAIITGLVKAAFGALRGLVDSFGEGGALPGTTGGEGVAQGASHDQGGIRTNIGGRTVEIEGGEHILRNGKETYIVNKKSSRIFGSELRALHGNTNSFSPMKRALAEQINTFKGFGRAFAPVRKFADGGALSISPLSAPVLPSQVQATNEVLSLSNDLKNMVVATNRRIDRLVVVAKASELSRIGTERAEIKQARSL